MKQNTLSILFIFFSCFLLVGQDDGIKLNTEEAFDGYSFIMNNDATYLLNNCGEKLNTWDISNAYYHPKIWDNGNIGYLEFEFSEGVLFGVIREKDWAGNLVNSVAISEPGLELVYEIHLLPNGNYLCATRRAFSDTEFIELGYDIPFTSPSEIDGVAEIDRNTGEIVWEWNVKDHVIQERDPNANNYGDVSAHPELINMDAVSTFDWTTQESFMINSIGYNAERDEILISMRKMCEIMIIDHSTTAEEAKGHEGGRHGKGGDIIYRWGNPQNYGAGTVEDQRLFYQHNPHWIKDGIHKDKIMVFSNGLNRPNTPFGAEYSTIPVLSPPLNADDLYVLEEGQAYGPSQPDIEYRGDTPGGEFYSGYTSGADFLPNGNVYVTTGGEGRAFELNPEGQIVWEYKIYRDGYIYRSHKYSKDHPAFEGKDLTPNGTVETPSSNYNCELFTSIIDHEAEPLEVKFLHQLGLQSEGKLLNERGYSLSMEIINVFGQSVSSFTSSQQEIPISLIDLNSGNYVLLVTEKGSNQVKAFKMIKL